MQPDTLAQKLGTTGKRLRGFMRKEFPRAVESKGSRWDITPEQAAVISKAWVERKSLVKAAYTQPLTTKTQEAPKLSGVEFQAAEMPNDLEGYQNYLGLYVPKHVLVSR